MKSIRLPVANDFFLFVVKSNESRIEKISVDKKMVI